MFPNQTFLSPVKIDMNEHTMRKGVAINPIAVRMAKTLYPIALRTAKTP